MFLAALRRRLSERLRQMPHFCCETVAFHALVSMAVVQRIEFHMKKYWHKRCLFTGFVRFSGGAGVLAYRRRTLCAALLLPALVFAGEGSGWNGQSVRWSTAGAQDGVLRLQASQAPLGAVFGKIASETGVRLHYSIPSEQLVTVDCAGTTLRQVLACLLGPRADLVFRYAKGAPAEDEAGALPAEIWVLASSVDADDTPLGAGHSGYCTALAAQGSVAFSRAGKGANSTPADPAHANPDVSGSLVELANAEDPRRRADAIARLTVEGRADDPAVRQTLLAALADDDANVRAQAVSAVARRDGAGANTALREALHDGDESVRLMAVDSAGSDAQGLALLQEALLDSDETVRALAAMKLEPFSKTAMAQ